MDKLKKYMEYNYKISVEHVSPDEGGGYRVSIPQLGDQLFQEHGDTINEAIARLNKLKKILFTEYIKKDINIPPPEKDKSLDVYSGRFVVRVPKALHRKLARLAKEQGVSLNQYINYLLIEQHSLNKVEKIIENFEHKFANIFNAYDIDEHPEYQLIMHSSNEYSKTG